MTDLIAELLQATEPSPELDAMIWWEVDRSAAQRAYNNAATGRPRQVEWPLPAGLGRFAVVSGAPAFTSSIDAALKLMRNHYLWQLKQDIGCSAIVWWIEYDWDDTGAPTAHSTTFPALALTTAALIARAVEDRVGRVGTSGARGK